VGGQPGDVHVLASGICATNRRERAGVLGHDLDAERSHRAASASAAAAREHLREDGRADRAEQRVEQARALLAVAVGEHLRDHLPEGGRLVGAEGRGEAVGEFGGRRVLRQLVEVVLHGVGRAARVGPVVLLQQLADLIHPVHKFDPPEKDTWLAPRTLIEDAADAVAFSSRTRDAAAHASWLATLMPPALPLSVRRRRAAVRLISAATGSFRRGPPFALT
jgi:hypothetical protein